MPDLITNARARFNLPSAAATDETTISTLLSAASRAIQRYCRRDFVPTLYDELYSGTGDRRLLLRHYPLLSVQAVRCRPATVLTIANTNAVLNQQARVCATDTGLTLTRTVSGVVTTDTSVTFAAHVTLTALAGAVTALGNGWAAQVVAGFGSWPSADLRAPQGAFDALGQSAQLQLHTTPVADFQIEEDRGWLLRGAGWVAGAQNFRVQYTAGYATVSEDVQEACAELVATWFQQRGRDLSLRAEDTAGTYRYEADSQDQLPRRVRALLRPYRNHRV